LPILFLFKTKISDYFKYSIKLNSFFDNYVNFRYKIVHKIKKKEYNMLEKLVKMFTKENGDEK
uniref:hypothetical protein n=1 Tax=Erysipelatoclostridium sp. AM42-17 TaxID=2293102 RepID=UPI000FF5E60F